MLEQAQSETRTREFEGVAELWRHTRHVALELGAFPGPRRAHRGLASLTLDSRGFQLSLIGRMESLPYNREELLASVDGDEEVVREVIGLYLDSAPQLVSAMNGALKKEDAAAAADAAHSLKGSLMMLRAHPAAAVAKEIELAIRRSDLGTARGKLPALEVEAKRLASALLADSSRLVRS